MITAFIITGVLAAFGGTLLGRHSKSTKFTIEQLIINFATDIASGTQGYSFSIHKDYDGPYMELSTPNSGTTKIRNQHLINLICDSFRKAHNLKDAEDYVSKL